MVPSLRIPAGRPRLAAGGGAAAAAAAALPRRCCLPPRASPAQQLRMAPCASPPAQQRGRICRVAAPDAAPEAADGAAAVAAEGAAEEAAAPAAPAAAIPKIADLDAFPIVDGQGLVNPLVPAGSCAHVFAILDVKLKLQYIGFSSGLRISLRTLLGRRPDKAYYFKAHHLPVVDQEAMVAVREAWYEECGGAPPGNKLALEREQWQQPVDSGAISVRGKRGAAEDKARELLALIRNRGCTEPFTPAPELLDEGLVDFLAVSALSEEQLATAREAAAKAAKESRSCSVLIDGQPKHFTVRFLSSLQTNGGVMYDVGLTYANEETKHRVIVGREYYEPEGIAPELPVEAALAVILQKKLPRTRTPGTVLPSSQFPATYFSIGGVEQWFPEDFVAIMDDMSGKRLRANGEEPDYWRFNRINDYGPMRREDPASLSVALGLLRPM
ncbi:hypothetical protein Rsub_00892 [Raphidocelis subcapitata]|uniref:Uncharacterized protein n=1 Tax=Raphidocelis subcapitata TaxID=307507 RepID=A0A2V0NRI6_9CHLO|nr:hypothetical protein Rsub_00892 [Raphidocelis subcapitata]|eukprot:GBF88180.1 hypothetical protein Rsub_00892 [Raphidocelis subcapitata]